ncbi:MAG: trypsin-like peptidase domain-containing protein [Pseudomonadota bacterium]
MVPRRAFSRILALVCVLSAVTLFNVPQASASSLIRLTDRDDLFGWEAVGRVDLQGGGFCTGVLISPVLVLTAAHCVYDRAGRRVPLEGIRFHAGLRDGNPIASRKIARAATAEEYEPLAGMSAVNIRNDAALLELQEPIPSSIAAPFALHERPVKGDALSVVSYGRGRAAALSWQRNCNVLGQGQGLVAFDCNVTFGSSGAPVFTDGGRRARIVTLVVGGRKEADGKTIAYGMDLPPVVDALKRKLRAMPKAAPSNRVNSETAISTGRSISGAKFAKP